MDFFADFNVDKCIKCGECFSKCPVMKLPSKVAVAEVERLAVGRPTKHVVRKCTSCFSCNFICAQKANPAQRILKIWNEKGNKEGFPIRAKHFTPDCDPNFRTHVLDGLPEDEKGLVALWSDTSPCDEIFFPGCNIITSPYLTKTKLLDKMNIRGGLNLCCGEMYYRTAQFEMVEKTAKRLNQWREKLKFKKMIIPCTAGLNMFTNVLPRFGFNLDFKIEHFLSILLSRFENRELEIKSSLNMTVTVQDSCHGKFFGNDFMDVPRKLLEIIGADVIEQEHCKQNVLCCGIGGGFSQPSAYHPVAMTLSTLKNLHSAKKSGAKALAVYCAGCLQMLSVGQLLLPSTMKIYHLLELIQMAIGEKPDRLNKKRAAKMLSGTLRHQVPTLVSTKRFNVK